MVIHLVLLQYAKQVYAISHFIFALLCFLKARYPGFRIHLASLYALKHSNFLPTLSPIIFFKLTRLLRFFQKYIIFLYLTECRLTYFFLCMRSNYIPVKNICGESKKNSAFHIYTSLLLFDVLKKGMKTDFTLRALISCRFNIF